MIPTNAAYNQALNDDDRNYDIDIEIKDLNGGFVERITNKDLVSFSFNDACTSTGSFSLGGTYAKNISFTIDNHSGKFDGINFGSMQSRLYPTISLAGCDMNRGTFFSTSFSHEGNYINVEAADLMVVLGSTPFRNVKWYNSVSGSTESWWETDWEWTTTWNFTLGAIVGEICSVANINWYSFAGQNDTITLDGNHVKTFCNADTSCRDIIGYIAELAGGYARIGRDDYLCIETFPDLAHFSEASVWGGSFSQTEEMLDDEPYTDGDSVDGGTFAYETGGVANGGAFTDVDYHILGESDSYTQIGKTLQYDGMEFTDNVTKSVVTYPVIHGELHNVLKVNNPLLVLQTGYSNTITERLWAGNGSHRGFQNFSITPFEGSFMSDLSREAGDKCVVFDHKGKQYQSLILSYSWEYGNMEVISARVNDGDKNITIN